MEDLTARQSEILEAIRRYIAEERRPPSRPELARLLGIASTNGVFKHLAALEKKGAIELSPGSARGIRIREERGLPLIGRVAAGSPILAQEHIASTYHVEASLFSRRPDYLLKVRGMSMRDAGIMDGDLLAVQKAKEAKNGQIVVARVYDDVTVKRFKRTRSGIELIPENAEFETIHVRPGDAEAGFEIEGLAVGLIRNNMLM